MTGMMTLKKAGKEGSEGGEKRDEREERVERKKRERIQRMQGREQQEGRQGNNENKTMFKNNKRIAVVIRLNKQKGVKREAQTACCLYGPTLLQAKRALIVSLMSRSVCDTATETAQTMIIMVAVTIPYSFLSLLSRTEL